MSDLIIGIVIIVLGIFLRSSKFEEYTEEISNEDDDFLDKEKLVNKMSKKSIYLIIFGIVLLFIGYLRLS